MTVGDRTKLRGLRDVCSEIRAQIRERRQQLGLTQRDMGNLLGTSQGQYSGWEKNTGSARGDMMLSSIFRAAHVLGLEVHVVLVRKSLRDAVPLDET